MLGKEEILSRDMLKREKVSIPELEGDFYVREFTGDVRDWWEQAIHRRGPDKELQNVRAKLVVATLVTESGEYVFSTDDVDRVGRMPSRILDKIYAPAARINGLLDSDLADAKKNSEVIQPGDSISS